jgi:uncharacterized glyoxalase superfamily protein PhnB
MAVVPLVGDVESPAGQIVLSTDGRCESTPLRLALKQLVIPNEDGTIAHAQLCFGNGMIMLGSAKTTDFGRFMKQPDEIGGAETQTAYVVAADPDAIYGRAKAAGAVIELDIKDEDYGGRGFTCRDLEGHLWTFGSYDPWEEH